jgi:phosphate starvation-inducible membrane PsiE
MQLTLFVTATFVTWLVLWAIGEKPIDAFIYSSAFLLIGLALHIVKHHLPNRDSA